MRLLLVMALAGASAVPAFAASDDAWEQFRADVEAACLKAAEPLFETAALLDAAGVTRWQSL